MIELTLLALVNRLTNWGLAPVIVSRVIAADVRTLRALVLDGAPPDGLPANARLRPHVVPTTSERLLRASVRLGRRDVLWLTWILAARRGTTEVDLAAQLDSHGVLARLMLLLGGRRWLRRRLEAELNALAIRAHRTVEAGHPQPLTPVVAAGRRCPARTAAQRVHRHA